MTKKHKRYNLKTIEDISKMVNDKNIMDFLRDFNECMIRLVNVRKKNKLSAKKVYMTNLEWINDGKFGISSVKINPKK